MATEAILRPQSSRGWARGGVIWSQCRECGRINHVDVIRQDNRIVCKCGQRYTVDAKGRRVSEE